MLDYQNVKIPEEIIIVEKPIQYSWYQSKANGMHQGYVVDANNKKMLETALNWAKGTTYDESLLEGKNWWECSEELKKAYRATAKEVEGIQHKYTNGNFKLRIIDSADNSSQGGKLSFWNCGITCPDGLELLVGINADILLELLITNTFVNGVCPTKVWLGRVKGTQVGAFSENMELFEQAKKDEATRRANAAAGSNYKPGALVSNLTNTEIYIGTLYTAADFDDSGWRRYTLTVYKKPQVRHFFLGYDPEKGTISRYVYGSDIKKTKPKRVINGQKDIGMTPHAYLSKIIEGYYKEGNVSDYSKFCYDKLLLGYADTPEEAMAKQEEFIALIRKQYSPRDYLDIKYED